jgi:hypothetical protein
LSPSICTFAPTWKAFGDDEDEEDEAADNDDDDDDDADDDDGDEDLTAFLAAGFFPVAAGLVALGFTALVKRTCCKHTQLSAP